MRTIENGECSDGSAPTAKFMKIGHLVGEAPGGHRSLCGKYFLYFLKPET